VYHPSKPPEKIYSEFIKNGEGKILLHGLHSFGNWKMEKLSVTELYGRIDKEVSEVQQ
jgi:hypothetical protein